MPEYVEGEDLREAEKAERLARRQMAAAMSGSHYMSTPDEIPPVAAYGHFSHLASDADRALEETLTESEALSVSAD